MTSASPACRYLTLDPILEACSQLIQFTPLAIVYMDAYDDKFTLGDCLMS